VLKSIHNFEKLDGFLFFFFFVKEKYFITFRTRSARPAPNEIHGPKHSQTLQNQVNTKIQLEGRYYNFNNMFHVWFVKKDST